MSVLYGDIITPFWLSQSITLEETTSLSPLRSRDDFFILLFIQGEPLPNVEDCGRTGQLPGVNVHA